mmetsp:Transcript_34798/g.42547  ORF Transcript_34798/g.42547 Transcript_34798/m.42547 type:complete len:139 (+) Transcript_34798:2359-2775(+)
MAIATARSSDVQKELTMVASLDERTEGVRALVKVSSSGEKREHMTATHLDQTMENEKASSSGEKKETTTVTQLAVTKLLTTASSSDSKTRAVRVSSSEKQRDVTKALPSRTDTTSTAARRSDRPSPSEHETKLSTARS